MSTTKIFGWAAFWIVALSIFGLAMKVLLFPVNVASTVINSAEQVIGKTLNANNVLSSYEWFFDTNAQFESRKGQIRGHSALVKAETDSKEKSRLNIELSAMQQSCRDMATKYNANSEKMNKTIFKSKGLPETLTLSNCEI